MENLDILAALSSADQSSLVACIEDAVQKLKEEPFGELANDLRAIIAKAASRPEDFKDEAELRKLFATIMLLAFNQDKSSFGDIYRIARNSDFIATLPAGHWFFREFHRIIGALSVSDDLPMIGDLILDANVNSTVREQALLTFHFLLLEEIIPEKDLVEEYRQLLERGLPPDDDWKLWMALVVNASVIGGAKLKPYVTDILDRGVMGEQTSFVRKAVTGLFGGGSHRFREMLKKEHKGLFTNPQEEVEALLAEPVEETGEMPERGKPIVREDPKIGRNDPCPCGSGKKYKKCCGQ